MFLYFYMFIYFDTQLANNVNLILNTYRSVFFKLLLRTFDVVRQLRPLTMPWQTMDESARQDSVEMERF